MREPAAAGVGHHRQTHPETVPELAGPPGPSPPQRRRGPAWCTQRPGCIPSLLPGFWPHCQRHTQHGGHLPEQPPHGRARRGPQASPHLRISGSVTSLPALIAAFKEAAPSVSMQMTGTPAQPTCFSPSMTPQRRPPPPTATTTAPGLQVSESLISCMILAWPSLGQTTWSLHYPPEKLIGPVKSYPPPVKVLKSHHSRG